MDKLKEFKARKSEAELYLPALKADAEKLNEMVSVYEDFIKNGTLENLQSYQNHLIVIVDSLKAVFVM